MVSENRVKIHWASGMKAASGNALGYWTHDHNLKKYARRIADITSDADNALFIVSPEYFNGGIKGKANFFFTMFESPDIPPQYAGPIKKADFLFAPSKWVKKILAQIFDEKKIFVCSHGVDPVFSFTERGFPTTRPFRFLWVGAPNPRKGWEEVIHTWNHLGFNKRPEIELYIKTTVLGEVKVNGNVILDGRKLSIKDLVKVYHDAHCFLFPSRGEGFGLTLAEAMRTGLPCIGTDYSGQRDFFGKSVGYPIGYNKGEGIINFVGVKKEEKAEIAYPKIDEMAQHMINIYSDYDKALKKGRLAANRISKKFTWENSAQVLVNQIRRHGK